MLRKGELCSYGRAKMCVKTHSCDCNYHFFRHDPYFLLQILTSCIAIYNRAKCCIAFCAFECAGNASILARSFGKLALYAQRCRTGSTLCTDYYIKRRAAIRQIVQCVFSLVKFRNSDFRPCANVLDCAFSYARNEYYYSVTCAVVEKHKSWNLSNEWVENGGQKSCTPGGSSKESCRIPR